MTPAQFRIFVTYVYTGELGPIDYPVDTLMILARFAQHHRLTKLATLLSEHIGAEPSLVRIWCLLQKPNLPAPITTGIGLFLNRHAALITPSLIGAMLKVARKPKATCVEAIISSVPVVPIIMGDCEIQIFHSIDKPQQLQFRVTRHGGFDCAVDWRRKFIRIALVDTNTREHHWKHTWELSSETFSIYVAPKVEQTSWDRAQVQSGMWGACLFITDHPRAADPCVKCVQ